MTVQFPDVFVIAGAAGIEIANPAEVVRADFLAARIVAAPLDSGSGVERQAEKRKAMASNLAGYAADFFRKVRIAQRAGHGGAIFKRGRRLPHFARSGWATPHPNGI